MSKQIFDALTVRLPPKEKTLIDQMAKENGLKTAVLVRKLIQDGLKHQQKQPEKVEKTLNLMKLEAFYMLAYLADIQAHDIKERARLDARKTFEAFFGEQYGA